MKNFSNLFPEDLRTIIQKSTRIQRSTLIFYDGKWREVWLTGEQRTASGVYNFVTIGGTIYIRRASAKIRNTLDPIGHVDLALGQEVDYAGRIYFSGRGNRGILRKWTNESGHYKPSSDFKNQARLPDELFQSGQF